MKKILCALALSAITLAAPAIAQQAADHAAHAAAAASTADKSAALTEGEVRKVDSEAKKITIRHGPLENLGMPGMTMVFQVKDPAMVDQVKAGDKIRFAADKVGGAFTVTQIEQAN